MVYGLWMTIYCYLSSVDLILDYAFLFDPWKIATMCLKYVSCVDKCDIKKYIID